MLHAQRNVAHRAQGRRQGARVVANARLTAQRGPHRVQAQEKASSTTTLTVANDAEPSTSGSPGFDSQVI